MPFSLRAKSILCIARPDRGLCRRALAAVSLSLFVFAAQGCKSGGQTSANQSQADGENGEPKRVRVVRVAATPVARDVSIKGTLAAYEQATLRAKVPGRVRSVNVDAGSAVRRGQLVAQLESDDYKLRVDQATAALAQARSSLGLPPEGTDDRVDAELTTVVREARAALNEKQARRDRAAKLLAEGVIAQAEYEAADAELKDALARFQKAVEEVRQHQALLAQRRSELAIARQQLTDTSIRASFDGVVQEKKASAGDELEANAPVATVVRINPLRLRAEVPEGEAQGIHLGQRVEVTIEGGAAVYAGSIKRLSPAVSIEKRLLVVEVEVGNDGTLRPGASVNARIETDEAVAPVTIPASAVVIFDGVEKVLLVENGRAVERAIKTGRRDAEWTEILGGIELGDLVVVEPANLHPGEAVSIVE